MRKKYTSPLFAELDLEIEDVLFDSALDNNGDDNDFGSDFDGEEEDFQF